MPKIPDLIHPVGALKRSKDIEVKIDDPPAPNAVSNHLAKLRVGLYSNPLHLLFSRLWHCPSCAIIRICLFILLAIGFMLIHIRAS